MSDVLLDNSVVLLCKLLEICGLGILFLFFCGLEDFNWEMVFMCGFEGSFFVYVDELEIRILVVLKEVVDNGVS